MLMIRRTQMGALKKNHRLRFVVEMALHLRNHFPDAMSPFTEAQLYEHIAHAFTGADSFGIVTRKHICKFLNLCALYGWKFWEQPQNEWMRNKYLENPGIPSPNLRLDLLTNQCLWRLEVEEHNRELRESTRIRGKHTST